MFPNGTCKCPSPPKSGCHPEVVAGPRRPFRVLWVPVKLPLAPVLEKNSAHLATLFILLKKWQFGVERGKKDTGSRSSSSGFGQKTRKVTPHR